jgi:hypothetical protein
MRIGLLTSVGPMLDQFFPEIVREWESAGHTVLTASGTPAEVLPGTLIGGLTRRPALSARRAQRELRVWSIEEALDVVVTNSATASALVRTAGLRTPDCTGTASRPPWTGCGRRSSTSCWCGQREC